MLPLPVRMQGYAFAWQCVGLRSPVSERCVNSCFLVTSMFPVEPKVRLGVLFSARTSGSLFCTCCQAPSSGGHFLPIAGPLYQLAGEKAPVVGLWAGQEVVLSIDWSSPPFQLEAELSHQSVRCAPPSASSLANKELGFQRIGACTGTSSLHWGLLPKLFPGRSPTVFRLVPLAYTRCKMHLAKV